MCGGLGVCGVTETAHKAKDVARSPDFVKELHKKVRKDPGRRIRSMVTEMNVWRQWILP